MLLDVLVKELDLKTLIVKHGHLPGREAQVVCDKKPWSFMLPGYKERHHTDLRKNSVNSPQLKDWQNVVCKFSACILLVSS